MAESQSAAKLAGRVQVLENSVESLTNDVHDLGRSMERNALETRQAIKELGLQYAHSQKTPWSTLGTWAGVLLTTCALIGGLVAFGINSKIDHVDGALQDHVSLPGHMQSLERMGRNDERLMSLTQNLIKLDEVLQREMRILDDRQDAQLKDMDTRLQMEMRLLDATVLERIKAVEGRVDRIQSEQARRTGNVYSKPSK